MKFAMRCRYGIDCDAQHGDRMELRHLRYFLAVAECENFHRAAARLHVAQPALSRQVRALEEMLGVTLFERLPRGTRLTEPGHAFLEDVRRILADLARAQDRVRRVGQGHVGTVRVGLNEIAVRQPYLPGFFRAIREQSPEIDIRVTMLVSQLQIEALRAGTIDVGFLFHRPAEDQELRAILIDSDDHVIAMPRTHHLACKPKLYLADLADEPFIMMSQHSNRVLYDRLLAACVAGGLVPRQVHEANNEYVIINLVAAGVGLAFLNRSLGALPSQEVILRQVEDLSLPVSLELVWRHDNRSAAVARFVETVTSSEQVARHTPEGRLA
jgi:DNA-binding transcriptional LysR family regulator